VPPFSTSVNASSTDASGFLEGGNGRCLAVVNLDDLVEADNLGTQPDRRVQIANPELAIGCGEVANECEKDCKTGAAEIFDATEVQVDILSC
jgi:hypothetical protein